MFPGLFLAEDDLWGRAHEHQHVQQALGNYLACVVFRWFTLRPERSVHPLAAGLESHGLDIFPFPLPVTARQRVKPPAKEQGRRSVISEPEM